MTSAPQLIWRAFGAPAPEGKTGTTYRFEPCRGACATCAEPIDEGVPFEGRRKVAGINNPTFSGYAEFARWGTHVCRACAWLYGDPKRTGRGVLAIGDRGYWPTIAAAIEGRPRWRDILPTLATDPAAPMTGVLTTDPKRRLWPLMPLATCAAPMLYAHLPDDDLSAVVPFDLSAHVEALARIDAARAAGVNKFQLRRPLWNAPKLVDALGLDRVAALEARLAPLRGSIAFAIALTVA